MSIEPTAGIRPFASEGSTLRRVALSLFVIFLLVAVSFFRAGAAETSASTTAIDSVLSHGLPLKDKVVFVDFWASWCVPCRHSFPFMKVLAQKYSDKGLQIITVNLDKKHADAEKFLHDTQTAFQVVYDSTAAIAKLFKVDAMPTSFLYGRDGLLHSRYRGFQDNEAASLDSTISMLLNTGNKK